MWFLIGLTFKNSLVESLNGRLKYSKSWKFHLGLSWSPLFKTNHLFRINQTLENMVSFVSEFSAVFNRKTETSSFPKTSCFYSTSLFSKIKTTKTGEQYRLGDGLFIWLDFMNDWFVFLHVYWVVFQLPYTSWQEQTYKQ